MATIRNVLIRIGVSERGAHAGIKRLTRSLQGLAKTSAKVGKMAIIGSAAVGGLSALAGAGAVSATSMLQLGAALAPLAGLLAALPGAAALGVAGVLTLKVALSGLGDAFGAALSGNQEKFDKALDKMGPAAQRVAKEFKALVPTLHGIRNAVQSAFFGPLHGQMTAVAKVLAGPVKTAMSGVAAEFGRGALEVARFARQAKTVSALSRIFGSLRGSLAQFRPAIQPLLGGFRDIAVVGAAFFRSLAPMIASAAKSFGGWLSQVSKSGQAMQWMKDGFAVLRQLGAILVNVGGILRSVFSAAGASGGNLLGTFGQLTAYANQFLKSAEGTKALTSIFSGIAAIGKALSPVFGALVNAIGLIAPAIGRIAIVVGPVLTMLINALAPALAALEPGITAIIQALGGAAAQIIPAVGRIATLIGPIVATALSALGPALTALEPGLTALITGLGGAVTALAPALLPIAKAIAGIAVGLAPVLPALGQLIAMLALGLAAHIMRMLPLLPPLVQAIITLGLALGKALLDALIAISPQLPALVKAMTDLLLALIPAIPSIIELVLVLVPLIPIFSDIIVLVSQLVTAVMPAFLTTLRLVGNVLKVVVGIVTWAWHGIYGVIKWVIDKVRVAISWLSTLPTKFSDWFGRARTAGVDRLTGLLRFIKGVPGKIVGFFGKAGDWLRDAGKDIMTGLWNGISSMAGKIGRWVGDLIKRIIPGPIRRVLNLGSPSRLTAYFGRMVGEGFVRGMDATRGIVSAAAQGLAAAATPQLAAAGAPGMATPVGVTRSAGSGGRIDSQELARAVAAEVAAAMRGVTVRSYLDEHEITARVSRNIGRETEQRRRTR